MGISTKEQETTVNYYRDNAVAEIYTSDSTQMTRLDKLCKESPDFYKLVGVGKICGEVVSKTYECSDKSLISFRKAKREMSEEQKQAASERFKKMWSDKNE